MEFLKNPSFNIDIILTVLIIIFYFVSARALKKYITKYGKKRQFTRSQRIKLVRLLKFFLSIGFILILTLVWGLNMKDIWVLGSVILGFIGVAVFAVWSLLSNVLAAYILFFSEPFQIGDFVILKDGDNSIEGEVMNMTTFYVKVKLDNGAIANIPNNVTFQKILIKCPAKL